MKKGLYEKFFKRLLDIILSFLAIILLSPIILMVSILVYFKLGSPVFFTQERPGKDEKIFKGTSKNTSRASRASNLSLIYSLFLVNFCL